MDIVVLDREVARQQAIFAALPMLADLLRSDVVYYAGETLDQLSVAIHAQPHSIASVYPANRQDQPLRPDKEPFVQRSIRERRRIHGFVEAGWDGAGPIYQEVWPIIDSEGACAGAISIETRGDEYESSVHRERNLQRALFMLKDAVVRGDVRGAGALAEIGPNDGLLVVEPNFKIVYVSSAAQDMYVQLGVTRRLTGQMLDALGTGDEEAVTQCLQERQCVQSEETVRGATWIRRVVPLIGRPPVPYHRSGWLMLTDTLPEPKGALLVIRDITSERRIQQDKTRLEMTIKEIHHRVKNNLQTIISLARIEGRRAASDETKRALEEFTNRVFAVAQVHDCLSEGDLEEVQLKELSRQIARQVRDSLLPKDTHIAIEVEGDPVCLSQKQATACALIINELVQNAVEHAFENDSGTVRVQLADGPERVRISVVDNGRGLPAGFEWRHSEHLGLKIVRTMVQDVRGSFCLHNQESPAHGLLAEVTLAKLPSGGK